MEPDRFFRQHVALDEPDVSGTAFRPFWRIRTRLDQLLIDRAITPRQWQAAQEFRSLAELIKRSSWRTQAFERTDGAMDMVNALARRLDARERLETIRAALGPTIFRLLELHVVDNTPWRELGDHYGVHPKTARRWVIIALKGLALVGHKDFKPCARVSLS